MISISFKEVYTENIREYKITPEWNTEELYNNLGDKLSDEFNINLSELELVIANVEGVSSVPKLHISNKCKGQYSTNSYNIDAATKDKIIYPSLDPCVFEIKFPNSDIKGRAR